MAIINLDNFARGTVLQVKCRDGKTRTVTVKVPTGDGPQYPHRIEEDGDIRKRSVTNAGTIYQAEDRPDEWDIREIITEVAVDSEPSRPQGKPVARGYRRIDGEPKDIHGSKRWNQILWRDSSDNELRLFSVNDFVPSNYDQWFPLNEIEFQVEEITESLRLHRAARAQWSEKGALGFCTSFTRGFLAAKGKDFVQADYERAAREANSPA